MAAKIDTDDLVTCPICYEQFSDPKCLPCLHTFCLHCLKSYIITQYGGEGKKAKQFLCPVCRQEVTVTDANLTSEKIADTFPGNSLIKELIERSVETSAPREDENLCGPCFSDNEKTMAVSWCTYCLEPLCENCTKYHKRLKKTKHEIILIEEMTKRKKKSVELVDVDEPCVKHAGKVLEVYCGDHKEMCCIICLTTSHRKCEHVSTFEEIITGSKNNQSVESFTQWLNELEKNTDDLRMKTSDNVATLNTGHDELSIQVSTMVQQAKDKLDHLQASFQSKFQQIHKEEGLKITEKKEKIEIFHQNVKTAQKLLQTVREQGSPKQIFITKEKINQQIKHHMEGLKVDLKDTHCMKYVLNRDDMVTAILNSLTSVAEVQVKPVEDLSTSLNQFSDIVDSLYKKQIDIMAFEVSKNISINPGGQITGGTYLPDGRLVLIFLTSKKLRIYDRTGILISVFDVIDSPVDACLVSAFEIVVSFHNRAHIIKYEIKQNTFKEIRQIACKNEPTGLASTNDNIIVGYRSEIDVLSLDGQLIRRLSSRAGDHASCVALSRSGNVYYSDGNDVVCTTIEGQEIRRYKNPNLDRVTGIAIDKHEDVFVCGNRSNNVVVFSPDGKSSKILLTGINTCFYIGLDLEETNFFLGTLHEGCHFYSLRK